MKHSRVIPVSAVASFVAICFALTSCGFFGPKDYSPSPDATEGKSGAVVGEQGADLRVSGVRIVVPAGAAPTGTTVEAAFVDHQPIGLDNTNLVPLAQALKITLGEGLQPTKPLVVTIPVDPNLIVQDQFKDMKTTVAMMIQSEGSTTPDFVSGTWDPDSGAVTGEVPHLSWVWPVQLDIAPVVQKIRDTVLQSLGVEYPQPECVDKPLVLGDTTYYATSTSQAWVCVGAPRDVLTIGVYPNSAIPFLVSTDPSSEAGVHTDISPSTALSVAVGGALRFIDEGQMIVMPGTEAIFTAAEDPQAMTVHFEQYPAMLLLSILTKTLDVANGKLERSADLQKLAAAGCFESVLDSTDSARIFTPEVAISGVVKSFYSCVGTVLDLSLPAQIVLAILSSGPQLLVASLIGAVNELTDNGNFTSTINAVKKSVPKVSDGLTKFQTISPWSDGTLSLVSKTIDGSTAEDTDSAYCSGSEIAPRNDGYRCYWPEIYDPCFRSPTSTHDFLCLTRSFDANPPEITRLINMNTNPDPEFSIYVNPGPPEKSGIFRIELTDGTICSRHTGAGPQGVPGYPFWAGSCIGPSAGIWRVGESNTWNGDPSHYPLYPPASPGGYWQVAISVGPETAPAQTFDVKSAYR